MKKKLICVKSYPGVPKGSIAVDYESPVYRYVHYNIMVKGKNIGYWPVNYFNNSYWKKYKDIETGSINKYFSNLINKIKSFIRKPTIKDIISDCDLNLITITKESIRDPEINKSCVFKAGEVFNIGFDIGSDKKVGDIIDIDYYKCKILECNHINSTHKVIIVK